MGSWNKSGHISAACKPCDNPPPGQYCAYCISVQGCGTNFNDGTHAPLPGALVTWSYEGKTLYTCTTDSTGECCARFPYPSGATGLLTMVVTHDGYQDGDFYVSCSDPHPGAIITESGVYILLESGGKVVQESAVVASTTVTLNPIKSLVTFGMSSYSNNPIGCGTVVYPGGSCETDPVWGTCQGYVDITQNGGVWPVTYSCQPFIPPFTQSSGPGTQVPPVPCTWAQGAAPGCGPGYQANFNGIESTYQTAAPFCLDDNLVATVAGAAVELTYGPKNWSGCGSLPTIPTSPFAGNCNCAQAGPFGPSAMPFFVSFDGGTLTIDAPICINVFGLGVPTKTLVQSCAWCNDGNSYIFATCNPTSGLTWNFPGGCPSGFELGGQHISQNVAVLMDFARGPGGPFGMWGDSGKLFCMPYSGHGTIAATLPGNPTIANPFAGPVSVAPAGGRRGGPGGRPWPNGDNGPDPLWHGPAPRGPGLARKAANFARAAAVHVAHGRPQTPPAEAARRLALCESCTGPGGYWNPATRTCARPECGCNMDRKVTWADMACPIGKW